MTRSFLRALILALLVLTAVTAWNTVTPDPTTAAYAEGGDNAPDK